MCTSTPISKLKMAAILVNAFIFLFTLGMNYFSTGGNAVFPASTGDVSDNRATEITPSGGTFTIWAFIYAFQLAMIAYTLSLLFRANAPDILPLGYYVAYSFVCVCNFTWLLTWARYYTTWSFVFLVCIALSLETTLAQSYRSLHKYLEGVEAGSVPLSRVDVWCIRLFCQNGLIFYNAWLSVATCLNMTIVVQYDLGMDGSKAATGGLCVLVLLVVGWFVVENFVIRKYTRFTCVEYVVIVVATSGVLQKQPWNGGQGNQGFVLALLVIAAVLLLARVCLVIDQELGLHQRVKQQATQNKNEIKC